MPTFLGFLPRLFAGILAASLLTAAPLAARAQLIPASQCSPRPCGCADMALAERALSASNNSLAAWEQVFLLFSGPNPPADGAAARAAFDARNPPDSFMLNQMRTVCPTFNGGKIGGVDEDGNTLYDDCFCKAFCKDIVDATGAHEQRHHSNMVNLAIDQMVVKVGGAFVGESVPWQASVLTLSEIDAHQAGSDHLRTAIQNFMAQNATCTWTPLSAPAPAGREPVPDTLGGRIKALYQRIVGGAFR